MCLRSARLPVHCRGRSFGSAKGGRGGPEQEADNRIFPPTSRTAKQDIPPFSCASSPGQSLFFPRPAYFSFPSVSLVHRLGINARFSSRVESRPVVHPVRSRILPRPFKRHVTIIPPSTYYCSCDFENRCHLFLRLPVFPISHFFATLISRFIGQPVSSLDLIPYTSPFLRWAPLPTRRSRTSLPGSYTQFISLWS